KTHTALTTRAHRLACSLFSLGSSWFLLLVLVLHVHCVPGVPGSVPVREAAQEVLGWTIAVVPQPSGAYQHLGSEDSEGKHDKQGWRYLTGESESDSREQDDPDQRLPQVIRQRHTSDRRQGRSHPRTPRCVHDADPCRNTGGPCRDTAWMTRSSSPEMWYPTISAGEPSMACVCTAAVASASS